MNGYPPDSTGAPITPTPPEAAPQPSKTKPKRQIGYLFLGIAYPVLHYAVMLIVQIVALIVYRVQAKATLGAEASAKEIAEKATELYMVHSNLFSILSNAITVLIVIGLFFLIRSVMKKREEEAPTAKAYFSFKKAPASMILMTALLAFCFYHLVIVFIGTIGTIFPELLESYTDASSSLTGDGNMTFVDYLLQFIAVVISAPVCEELIYRNMAISNMRKAVPVKWAVVISSAIFGVAHGNLLWILYATALGIVFGIIYVRTESIWLSLAAHFVFNLVGFVYSLIPTDSLNETGTTILTVVEVVLILGSMAGGPLSLIWLLKKTRKLRPIAETEGETSKQSDAPTPPYGNYQQPYGNYQQHCGNYQPPYSYPPYPQNPYYGAPYGYPAPPQSWFDPAIGGYRTSTGVWYFHLQYGWQFVPYQSTHVSPSQPQSQPQNPTQADGDGVSPQTESDQNGENGDAPSSGVPSEEAPEAKSDDASCE